MTGEQEPIPWSDQEKWAEIAVDISVLDYLKGRLAARLPARLRPATWQPLPPLDVLVSTSPPAPAPEAALPPASEAAAPRAWTLQGVPWRAFLALGLMLLAQAALNPPQRAKGLGVLLYLAALGPATLALRRAEWVLPPRPVRRWRLDDGLVRVWPLAPAVVFSVLAFVLNGHNRFTGLGVLSWLLAIGLVMATFWEGDLRWPRLRFPLRLTVDTWHLLVGGALLYLVGFHFFRLGSVPLEMFSDHAEKLLDIRDVLAGQWRVFFPRNAGREAIQMYLSAVLIRFAGMGFNFLTLKTSMAIAGSLALPYFYLLGKEWGNRRVGLFLLLLGGGSYWYNVLARVGLRLVLYPAFVAPLLYHLTRALRHGRRNDFVLTGLFLGFGMYGYSAFRLTPLVVLAAVGLFLLHRRAPEDRRRAVLGLVIVVAVSFAVFLPLGRYILEEPQAFSYRMATRLTQLERPYPGNPVAIFFSNLGRALVMGFWDNGEVWSLSIPHRPALGTVTAALMALGALGVFVHYLRRRRWEDVFLLLSIPLLLMPSVLSIAFPAENPLLSRAGGALVPMTLLAALALDGLYRSWRRWLGRRVAVGGVAVLLFLALVVNARLIFVDYAQEYRQSAWNNSEIGRVMRGFADAVGSEETVWVVPYPYWVDTRLVGLEAGFADWENVHRWPEQLPETTQIPGPKMFILKPEDGESLRLLQSLYPDAIMQRVVSAVPGRDFLVLITLR